MNLLALRRRNNELYIGLDTDNHIIPVDTYIESVKFHKVEHALAFIRENRQLVQTVFNSLAFEVVQPDWSKE